MQHEGSLPPDRVAPGELWRWAAPWLLGALLVVVALLGLFTASRAQDEGAYAVGFVTAGLAVLALAWRIRRAFDGAAPRTPLPVLVDEPVALAIVVVALAVLAVVGLLLAARSNEAVVAAVGYALFGFSLVFLFWNLKHYFDGRERRPQG